MSARVARFGVCLLALLLFKNVFGIVVPKEEECYQDKLISPDALWVDTEAEESNYDDSGLSRGAKIELVKTHLNRNGVKAQEDGLVFSLRRETEGYGTLSLEGSLLSEEKNSISGWQRNLAFDGDWRANNGLGVINTSSINLVRRQYRFFIPTMAMVGGSTEWEQGNQTVLSAGVGQPGAYTGIRVPVFYTRPGTVFSAGVQTKLGSSWDVGVQTVGANDVHQYAYPNSVVRGPPFSTTGVLGSAAWTGSGARVQMNMIGVESSLHGLRGGGWGDAWFRGGAIEHNVGAFYLESGLMWGNQQIASDLFGGYYRANYHSRQWLLDGGVDYATSASGSKGTLFLTGNARYQMSRDWGYGAGGNARQGFGDARSVFSYVDNQNGWGVTRVQLNYAEDATRRSNQVTLEQTWKMSQALRLSTSASQLYEQADYGSLRKLGLSLYGGGDIGNNLVLDGNVQWYGKSGIRQGPSTYVNVALNWRFRPNWMLSIFAYENNATTWRPQVIGSPINNPDVAETQKWNDRGVFLSMRYEFSAGKSMAPLGGAPGEGGGKISGVSAPVEY